jgi:hypothetical protein
LAGNLRQEKHHELIACTSQPKQPFCLGTGSLKSPDLVVAPQAPEMQFFRQGKRGRVGRGLLEKVEISATHPGHRADGQTMKSPLDEAGVLPFYLHDVTEDCDDIS